MKKNQIMLTCSGIMLVLQSIAFYIVWSSGYSETMLRRMFLTDREQEIPLFYKWGMNCD